MKKNSGQDIMHVSYYVSGDLLEYVRRHSDSFGIEPSKVLRWFSYLGMLRFKEIRASHMRNMSGDDQLFRFIGKLKYQLNGKRS
jgi:hypothetical protein